MLYARSTASVHTAVAIGTGAEEGSGTASVHDACDDERMLEEAFPGRLQQKGINPQVIGVGAQEASCAVSVCDGNDDEDLLDNVFSDRHQVYIDSAGP